MTSEIEASEEIPPKPQIIVEDLSEQLSSEGENICLSSSDEQSLTVHKTCEQFDF